MSTEIYQGKGVALTEYSGPGGAVRVQITAYNTSGKQSTYTTVTLEQLGALVDAAALYLEDIAIEEADYKLSVKEE